MAQVGVEVVAQAEVEAHAVAHPPVVLDVQPRSGSTCSCRTPASAASNENGQVARVVGVERRVGDERERAVLVEVRLEVCCDATVNSPPNLMSCVGVLM